MHANPLVYFRASLPFDIESLSEAQMVGKDENRITYPIFVTTPVGDLIYYYRSGGSGNGDNIFNIYDVGTKTWRRLMDPNLHDGEHERNAYMHLRMDPTGMFHAAWVWRETPDAGTNHDLCYARSRDLRHWETADGTPLTLPVTARERRVVVDPIPVDGGIFNTMMDTGFDSQHRPILSYIKYDANGTTQLYFARHEGGRWAIRQATRWPDRIILKGKGWLELPLHIGAVRVAPGRPGLLLIDLRHGTAVPRRRTFMVDPVNLRMLGKAPPAVEPVRVALAPIDAPESTFPGMQVPRRPRLPRAPLPSLSGSLLRHQHRSPRACYQIRAGRGVLHAG